jgi:hypothetical protein
VTTKNDFPVQDNPSLVEALATHVVSHSYNGTTFTVTLGALRFVPDRLKGTPDDNLEPYIAVTTRFALTPGAARQLIDSLNRSLTASAPSAKGGRAN